MGGFESVCHPATNYVAHRECGRLQRNDEPIARALYERMGRIVNAVAARAEVSTADRSYRPTGFNPNIRLYRYDRGMSFGRHVDGSNRIPSLGGKTEMTVLVYLSSCRGGATRFYPPSSSRRQKGRKPGGVAFVPEVGAVLFHVHGDRCLEHEADPVEGGEKYILRTDLVYSRVGETR